LVLIGWEELCCDSEGALDESDLANNVILGYPANLAFADDVHGFVSCNRVQRAINGSGTIGQP
jgi:hypothetical protein